MAALSRKPLCFLAILFIFFVIFSPAFSTEMTVFGPETYIQTTGPPNVYTDTFSASLKEGILIIENGDEDGKHRVTSALVFLNGLKIVAPDDFKQQIYLMETPVDLSEGTNSIVVELRSKPGTYLTIRVIQEAGIPAVTINSDPETISVGEYSLLTWNSSNADTCTIEPGIGSVDVDGSTTVSPTDTTTYTITASGPRGTATACATVTVIYPAPTVSISADPETIPIGGSSTLAWSTQYADSCVIDPDIGSVDLNGSIKVSPTETTTYTITASNPVETATAGITVAVIPFTISITSPLVGDMISRPDIMVKGAIANPLGREVGITVNGIVAMVEGDQFVANHVLLEEGENVLTATALDWEGNSSSSLITVYAYTAGDYIRITADDESGTSPFETTLRIEGSFTFTDPYLTCIGPGVVAFSGSPEEHKYEVQITGAGVYYFTPEVDYQGETYTDTIAVMVLDQAELDALLRAKWEGMKTALANGDIEDALTYHHGAQRGKYEAIYNLLGSNLLNKVNQMQDIKLIYSKGERAKHRINRDHVIDGQTVTITYYIYFSKDGNGLWKIEKY